MRQDNHTNHYRACRQQRYIYINIRYSYLHLISILQH